MSTASRAAHLGIDLGTTNCVAAYVDASGQPRSVVNFEGDVLTPSALLIDGQTILVGREAIKASSARPDEFVECFKREMGREGALLQAGSQKFGPEFLSAVMLRRLKSDFERALGAAERAVVTVPAYFDEARRRATQAAARIAGWSACEIINEPTAAALSAAHRQQPAAQSDRPQKILVYDLGGGTFDTTVLEVRAQREYRTLATDGDVRLGGCDFDQRLCRHLAEQFQKKTAIDPLKVPSGQLAFLRLARQIKHTLSTRESAEAPASFGGKRAILSATRQTFEALTADLLDRTLVTVRQTLTAAGTTWAGIDRLLLVGGSSRMPMVARFLARESGKAAEQTSSFDEAVAHGAAIYARLLETNSPVRVVNVNAHSLRIIGRKEGRRVAHEMIPRNSPLPASCTRLFPAARPDQKSVPIQVCEGELQDPEACIPIGVVRLSDLPPASGQPWKVAVTLKYRLNGTVGVKVSLRDPQDPRREIKQIAATLEPATGMDPSRIEAERHRLGTYQIS
jgi:molecular chaperone DnaK